MRQDVIQSSDNHAGQSGDLSAHVAVMAIMVGLIIAWVSLCIG